MHIPEDPGPEDPGRHQVVDQIRRRRLCAQNVQLLAETLVVSVFFVPLHAVKKITLVNTHLIAVCCMGKCAIDEVTGFNTLKA